MSAYPDLPISQLPAAGALDGTELFAVVQGGVTKYTSAVGVFSGYQSLHTNYGAFCSTGSQTNSVINVSRSMQLETTELASGVSVVAGSRITVANPGVYNLQFSAQLEKTNNGVNTVYIWFKKNGTNVPRSNTAIDVLKQAGGSGKFVAAWNLVDQLNANDYYEIMWQSDTTDMSIVAVSGSGNFPLIPSVIATMTQVA